MMSMSSIAVANIYTDTITATATVTTIITATINSE